MTAIEHLEAAANAYANVAKLWPEYIDVAECLATALAYVRAVESFKED